MLFEQGNTPWARATAFRFKTRIGMDFANLISPTNLVAMVEAKTVEGPWGAVDRVSGDVALTGSPTVAPGLRTTFNLKSGPLHHTAVHRTSFDPSFEAASAEVHASAWHSRTNWLLGVFRDLAETNRPLSQRFEQIPLDGDFSVSGAKAGAVDAEELLFRTKWQWPVVNIALEGRLEEAGLHATTKFNVTNGQAEFAASSDVDPHRISPLLTEAMRDWLTNYEWQAAPKLRAKGRLTIPSATNRLDWSADIWPSLSAEGAFELGPCRYRAVPMDSAKSPFWFSNSVFCLTDLELHRPEGSLRGQYASFPDTKDFRWRINSGIDPKVLRPLFPPEHQQAFSLVEFSSPPQITGEIWGRWGDPSRLGAFASVEATNFAIRSQPVQLARTGMAFTNLQLEFIEPEVIRPNERGNASNVRIDCRDQRIYFSNVVGNLDPQAVARAIGPGASNAIAPYIFSVPPSIELNGMLDIMSGRREDDMHFVINGGPFYWDPFHLHRIGGKIHWAGYSLLLNEVVAQLHAGQGTGDAKFQFTTNGPAFFQFRIDWSDIDLRSLMHDLSTRTNNLEGIIRGNLQITSATTGNPKSWNGRGMVELKDGLLWDFPMFGVFSPILNAFVPGLGNSRARNGISSYIITNSVIYTTDLEVNSTTMRMRYSGTFDFDRRIDGRMEAELLRNIPAVGLILSKVLWPVTKIFEYKISGTLEDPKTQPLYLIPKIILFPFSPIKTMKDLLGIEPSPPPPPAQPAPNK